MVSLDNGWIHLHRKIRDNWIWDDPEKLRAWIDILLMVNHEDKQIPFDGHIITIHKGQRLTSLQKLSERWGWSRNRVDRFLRLLNEAGMVTTNRTPNGTVLTVVNWAFYQSKRDTNGATNEATNGTANGATNEATNGTQTRMIKNEKNEKKGEGIPHPQPSPSLEDIKTECREQGYTFVNTEKFFSYYEGRNWKLGGEPINWKAMLRHWNLEDQKKQSKGEELDEDFWSSMKAKLERQKEERDESRRSTEIDNSDD